MRILLLLLGTLMVTQGEVLRVSRVVNQLGPNVEQMRYTTDRGVMTYRVEKRAILTNNDVASAKVVPGKKGVIAVTLTPEGAKKLSEATKGADGTFRLAIVVENVLESVPLVQAELKDAFWISGLDDRDEKGLKALAEAMGKKAEAGEQDAEEEGGGEEGDEEQRPDGVRAGLGEITCPQPAWGS